MSAAYSGGALDGWKKVDMNRLTPNPSEYKRSASVEPFRLFCRIADFILLLTVLRLKKRLPAFSELRRAALVELGPGPTRLASVKKLLFRKVFFVDRFDFGIPDPDLRIADLEEFEDAGRIITDVCGLSSNQRVVLFADHCLEHLPENMLLIFLKSVIDSGFQACFRVPNVLSSKGYRCFLSDSTHRTSFDLRQRELVKQMGFTISPWLRWYRPRLFFNVLIGRESLMKHSEEIAICTCRRSGATKVDALWNRREDRA